MAHIEGSRRAYRYWLFVMLALLLGVGLSAGVGVALAGDPDSRSSGHQANDAGLPYQPGPAAPVVSCTQTIIGSITASDPDQTLRLNRDGIPDTCSVPGSCGTIGTGSFNYDLHTFTNQSSSPQCMTVTLDTACTGANFIYSGAYLGSFNPANICQNWLADAGSSPNTTTTYSFIVPPNAVFVINVHEVTAGAGCASYTLTVSGDICASCPTQFSDVPITNTFYPSIRCLACRGIVSGYSDGTFRPNNPVTRGQLAKMVSNAAGFSEPHPGQTFEDVPPTNTFHVWVERLSSRGFMSGYPCGGPGEPCVSGKPYFRVNANATRGQTSKIVSNTAGFSEPPSGQTFQDVPVTYTFYAEIARLATRGIMQGYPCGGPGEPCVAPENRPYFRPSNNVTRGQSSKIVAGAFYPGCVTP